MTALVSFEANSIQSWIASGNRLTDLSGGSEILERLVSLDPELGILRPVLLEAGLCEDCVELNAAARLQLRGKIEACKRFCMLWPVVLASFAPGLQFRLELRDVGTQDIALFGQPGAQRLDGPFTARAARTGLAAQPVEIDGETIDAGTSRRRLIGKAAEHGLLFRKLSGRGDGLYELGVLRDADELSEREGRRGLAYVHADASGLGSVYAGLAAAAQEQAGDGAHLALKAFSEALNALTEAATRSALHAVARHGTPASVDIRPVLVGGDDMTMILPASLGHGFATVYMQAFVGGSEGLRETVKKAIGAGALWDRIEPCLPRRLHVGCGVAYVHPHFPASQTIHLAESLCDWAKVSVGRATSALAFHRITGSAIRDGYDATLEEELSAPGRRLTAGPYLLETIGGADDLAANEKGLSTEELEAAAAILADFPSVAQLNRLVLAAAEPRIPRGPQRELLDLARLEMGSARARLARMAEVAKDGKGRPDGGYQSAFAEVSAALRDMGAAKEGEADIWMPRQTLDHLLFEAQAERFDVTPLRDAHMLISVADRPGRRSRPYLPQIRTGTAG